MRTDSETITVTVAEANRAPTLSPISNQTVDEGAELAFWATATDPDLPANDLTYSLSGEPPGATITSSGRFSWIPTESQGPGTYNFDVIVRDDGAAVVAGGDIGRGDDCDHAGRRPDRIEPHRLDLRMRLAA